MNLSKKTKRWIWIILLILIAPPVLLFVAGYTGLIPATPINSWRMEIDLNSGRLRSSRLMFWITTQQKFEDTSISNSLLPENAAPTSDWRQVAMVSADVNPSVKYVHNGTLGQLGEIEALWKVGSFAPNAKVWIGKHILQTWQKTELGVGTTKYIEKLGGLAMSASEKGIEIDERAVQELALALENQKSPISQ